MFCIMCPTLPHTHCVLHPSLSLFLPFLLPSLPIPPPFSTSLAPCLWNSVDEAGIEDQWSDQSHSSGVEAEVQSTPGHVDQGQQQQRPELEDRLSDFQLEGNTSNQQENKVSRSLFPSISPICR